MCNHTKTVCPNHGGGFDCTPFCHLCEGEQEFCVTCCDIPGFQAGYKIAIDYAVSMIDNTLNNSDAMDTLPTEWILKIIRSCLLTPDEE